MKTLSNKFWCILIVAFFAMTGCQEYDDLLTENAQTGGFVEVQNALINYLVGDLEADYTVTLLVPQGDVKTTAIEVWVKFSNALGTGEEGLMKTVDVDNDVNSSFVEVSFSYPDLAAAAKLADGSSLPVDDDGGLVIGNNWKVSYRGITTAGNFRNAATTTVGVATRFAGTYNVIDKAYWRIGVLRSDLDGLWPPTIDIASIDVTTYLQLRWAGLFDGNNLYFTIDGDVIDYPENTPDGAAQVLNDQPITTCSRNPADMANANCNDPTTNTAVRVDPSGEDLLYMAFGYFTPGSGPREFYQVLEKKVD